jgi:hypothetical protein
MPAPEGNQFAAKPAKAKLNCRKAVMGTPDEVRAWNRAQARSGKKWAEWSRDALNAAAGRV